MCLCEVLAVNHQLVFVWSAAESQPLKRRVLWGLRQKIKGNHMHTGGVKGDIVLFFLRFLLLTGLILFSVPGVPASNHLTRVVRVLVELLLHFSPEGSTKEAEWSVRVQILSLHLDDQLEGSQEP